MMKSKLQLLKDTQTDTDGRIRIEPTDV